MVLTDKAGIATISRDVMATGETEALNSVRLGFTTAQIGALFPNGYNVSVGQS